MAHEKVNKRGLVNQDWGREEERKNKNCVAKIFRYTKEIPNYEL
jgi:hypothetical protein